MEDNKFNINLETYLPLREVVFNKLRDAIINGDLKPGERLMENQLAEKMGVSRTPIREAIRKLELEGLISMIPRKGAHVSDITIKDIKDVLEIRMALESLAIGLACEKISGSKLRELEKVNKEFKMAMNKRDIDILVKKDVEFHNIIFESTDNERLLQITNNLNEQIQRYRITYIKKLEFLRDIEKEHSEIIESLVSRDKERAKRAVEEHIINQEKNIIGYIKRTS